MANKATRLTKHGSRIVNDSWVEQNPSEVRPNDENNGYFGDVECQLSLDSSGDLYIGDLQKFIPAYQNISVHLNPTSVNLTGGPFGGFTGLCKLEGCIVKGIDTWVTLASGSITIGGSLKEIHKPQEICNNKYKRSTAQN